MNKNKKMNKNKNMKILKISIFLAILITCLFLYPKTETTFAVGICADPKYIDLVVNPTIATDTINIFGTINGDSTEEGLCPFPCGVPWIVVYEIGNLAYQIDGGSWVEMTYGYGQNWWPEIEGYNRDCYTCGEYQLYEYSYSKDIDISGLSVGDHTITVRATGGHCPSMEITTSFTFTRTTPVTFRHENCCDNWGWNNVRRCGGCCGVAANCVGYVN